MAMQVHDMDNLPAVKEKKASKEHNDEAHPHKGGLPAFVHVKEPIKFPCHGKMPARK